MKSNNLHKLNFLLIIILLVFQASCSHKHNFQNHMPQNIEVEAYTIKPQNSTKTIESVGEFISPQSTIITTDSKGKIVYLNIPEGKLVPSHFLIAKIEDSVNIAEVKSEQAKLSNAKENFDRIKKLYEEGAVSKQVFDNTNEKYLTTQAGYERIHSIENKNYIYTPFSGILSLKKISLGTYVDSGDEIVRISQISPLNLVFSIPEKYLNKIKTGLSVSFSSNNNKTFTSKISVIDPYIDPDSRVIMLQCSIPNISKNFLPGGFAKVTLDIENNPNIILIPEEAVINENSERYIYVVTKENTVKKITITPGEWSEGFVEIKKGLNVGDKVVTFGHEKLFPDAMVIVSDYVPLKNPYLDLAHPEDQ